MGGGSQPPRTITGSFQFATNYHGSNGGATIDDTWTWTVNVKLVATSIGSAENGDEGSADYADGGSTWTYQGSYKNEIPADAGGCASVEQVSYDAHGNLDGSDPTPPFISGRIDPDEDTGIPTLHLRAGIDQVTGQGTNTNGGTFCKPEPDDRATGASIDCMLPSGAGDVFDFVACPPDSSDQTIKGTLSGQ